jgi:hypothetical protein
MADYDDLVAAYRAMPSNDWLKLGKALLTMMIEGPPASVAFLERVILDVVLMVVRRGSLATPSGERSIESPHRRAIRIAGNLTRAHRNPALCPVDDEAVGLQEPPHKATALRSDSVWVPFGRAEAGLDRASCLTQVVDAHIYEPRLGRRSVPQRQAPSWQKLYLVEFRAWVRLGEAKSNEGAHEVPHLDGTR